MWQKQTIWSRWSFSLQYSLQIFGVKNDDNFVLNKCRLWSYGLYVSHMEKQRIRFCLLTNSGKSSWIHGNLKRTIIKYASADWIAADERYITVKHSPDFFSTFWCRQPPIKLRLDDHLKAVVCLYFCWDLGITYTSNNSVLPRSHICYICHLLSDTGITFW